MKKATAGVSLVSAMLLASCAGATPVSPMSQAALKNVKSAAFSQKLLVSSPGNSSIGAFGLPTSGGNVTPSQDIGGAATGLHNNFAVTEGPNGHIFADNFDGSAVYNFVANANGNLPPASTLGVAAVVSGLAIDSAQHEWVANAGVQEAPSPLEYASGAHGAATPINTIAGSSTQLGNPQTLAFDTAGYLYVANSLSPSGGNVLVFSPGSSGNASPARVINGTHTEIATPVQASTDNSSYGNGRLLVCEAGHVLVFAPGASGNVAPVADITSVANPGGVAADNSGNIYVSAPSDNQIRMFAPNATGNAQPILEIVGSATGLHAPGQLYIGSF